MQKLLALQNGLANKFALSESIAIVAAGCFWGVEEKFLSTPGVLSTEVGYIGGHLTQPNYKEVCQGDTGHAEAVKISFNPEELSFADLLQLFWQWHDPTQKNRQGPDFGTQYRTAIFYLDETQKEMAIQSKNAAQAHFSKPIATEIVAASTFWPAEEYHQQYLRKNPHRYC